MERKERNNGRRKRLHQRKGEGRKEGEGGKRILKGTKREREERKKEDLLLVIKMVFESGAGRFSFHWLLPYHSFFETLPCTVVGCLYIVLLKVPLNPNQRTNLPNSTVGHLHFPFIRQFSVIPQPHCMFPRLPQLQLTGWLRF